MEIYQGGVDLIRILLVNDHHHLRVETKKMIEKEKDMMVIIEDSKRVLDRVRVEDYDIVIVDLNRSLDEMVSFIRQIISANSDLAVLMVSDFDMEAHFDDVIHAGISSFIQQSFSREQMIRSIRSLKKGNAIIPTALFRKLRRG